MVVWQMPCESSSPPGSQLSQKAQSNDWAFLLTSKSGGEPFEQGIPMRQIGREPIWTASAGPEGTNPTDGLSTVVHRQPDKTACCRLTAQIQNQSAFKLTTMTPTAQCLRRLHPTFKRNSLPKITQPHQNNPSKCTNLSHLNH
jgi:hypothetical protein